MNVSTTKNRVTLHQSERRVIDKARKISQQLWKAYEMTGQQSVIAKTAFNGLSDLCQQLDEKPVDERQLAEVK